MVASKKKGKNNNPLVVGLLIIVIIILLISSVQIYSRKFAGGDISKMSFGKNSQSCPQQGITEDRDILYTAYTVERGDSLLSIAKNELSDTTRVGDIIYINQQVYPGLSMQNPLIEVGWKIYLPPQYFNKVELAGSTPKLLYGEYGKIVQIDTGNRWIIETDELNPKRELIIDTDTQFVNSSREIYEVGDCIFAVREQMGNKVYAISLQ
jgi:hypothetical protein